MSGVIIARVKIARNRCWMTVNIGADGSQRGESRHNNDLVELVEVSGQILAS
jgi:hypothetical protein